MIRRTCAALHGLTAAVIGAGILTTVSAFPSLAETPRTEAEKKGWEIAREADRRNQGWKDTLTVGRMVLRDRQGDESARDIEIRTLEGEGNVEHKSLLVFKSPPDIRGTGLLTHAFSKGEDAQWLYLPALKRIKRISSSNKSGSFMGSEFTYEDLSPMELNDYRYKFLRDEKIDGKDHFVIERTPVRAESGYSKQIAWVDKAEYRTVKVDFYDRAGGRLKTLTASDFEKYLDKYWRARKLSMKNHLNGKSTDMIWREIRFRVGYGPADFTRTSLRQTD